MNITLTISFPKLLIVDDYHEFDYRATDLNELIGELDSSCKQKVKAVEVGFDSDFGRYIGFLYVGRKPTNKEMIALLKNHKDYKNFTDKQMRVAIKGDGDFSANGLVLNAR